MSAWAVQPEGLARWLREAGEPVVPPVRLSRVGRGQSNLVLRVEDRDGRGAWVVRRPPVGELLESAHDVVREYRIMRALQGTGVPIPRLVGLIEDPSVSDAPCSVMSYVEGVVVEDEAAARALTPSARHTLGLGLVDALARIHAVPVAQVGLGELASDRPYSERQLRRWTRQWRASGPDVGGGFDALTARLERSRPGAESRVLVHGDLHLRNAIATSTGHVNAIVDWELSTLGDPLADLGTLLAYWPQAGDRPTTIAATSAAAGFPTRAELVENYRRRTGRETAYIGFWHVLALWKIAVIAQGIRRRTRGARIGRADVRAIVDRATDVADREGI
jgi:aminoglycoside phosphotransferase (APT) family kinase protein